MEDRSSAFWYYLRKRLKRNTGLVPRFLVMFTRLVFFEDEQFCLFGFAHTFPSLLFSFMTDLKKREIEELKFPQNSNSGSCSTTFGLKEAFCSFSNPLSFSTQTFGLKNVIDNNQPKLKDAYFSTTLVLTSMKHPRILC